MQCRDFREMADSYLSDELAVETNHEVLKHLEICSACRGEIAARRELRTRLKDAVRNDKRFQMREGFAVELKNKLRESAHQQKTSHIFAGRKSAAWFAIAASVLLIALFVGIVIKQRLGNKSNLLSNENRAVKFAKDAMAHFAVGDHENCALQHNLEEQPISLEEAGKRYDKAYSELDKVVINPFAKGEQTVELLGAHACIYKGKKFAHVVLKSKGKIVSVLVIGKDEIENNSTASMNTDSISCQKTEGFQVSCFETSRHHVYVVSDLSEQDNLTIARTLQNSVTRHLA